MKEKVPRTKWLTWPFSSRPIIIFGKGLKLTLEPEFERILSSSRLRAATRERKLQIAESIASTCTSC